MTLADKYGPWALVAGASDGVGAAFAEGLAERGVNVVLLARRQAVLDDVAAGIEARTGAETRTLAVDLAQPGATTTIADATKDLQVGFLVYCAGADPNFEPFLANPIETAESMWGRATTSRRRWCSGAVAGSSSSGPAPDLRAARTWWPTAPPRRSTWCSPKRCGPNCTTRASTCSA